MSQVQVKMKITLFLSKRSDIIVGGGTLDGQQADTELYELSKACRVGACDAFFSHSWHDDREAKWNALQAWRNGFKEAHDGKEPNVWSVGGMWGITLYCPPLLLPKEQQQTWHIRKDNGKGASAP